MEMEIMKVLWKSDAPMTAADIVSASTRRTWKERSIYIMLKSLQDKGLVSVKNYRPATSKATKAYSALITKERYAASQVVAMDVDFVVFLQETIQASKKYEKEFRENTRSNNTGKED